jgi:hypothetical protein
VEDLHPDPEEVSIVVVMSEDEILKRAEIGEPFTPDGLIAFKLYLE